MRTVLAVILFVISSATVALCQNVTEQNHLSLSAIPVSDSLLEVQRKADRDSFRRIVGEKPSLSKAEPSAQGADETEGRFWVSAESLFWKMKDANLPPLITTGPFPPPGSALRGGVVGTPGTVIVFGGGKLDKGLFTGGRFTAGMWLNEQRNVGVELSYFFLPRRTYTAQASATGLPTGAPGGGFPVGIYLSRPVINLAGQEDAVVVSDPLPFIISHFILSGTSTGALSSRLQGGEANFIYRFDSAGCCRISLTGGFRYLDLDEQLTVTDFTQFDAGSGIVSHTVRTDAFFTRNQFYGAQVGARSLSNWGRLNLELSGALALGSNRQSVNINGFTTFSSVLRGVLAQPTNIGIYRRNEFTVVPEVRVSLGFDVTRYLRPFVSYDFLYWNKVVMTGDQIDRVINPDTVFNSSAPSQGHPAFTFRDSAYRAMGLTTGVKLRF